MKKSIVAAVLGLGMLGSLAIAKPKIDVSAHRHPNINEAQEFVRKAYEKMNAAEKANEYDMGGHAQKAKELLDKASEEMKLAAEGANEHEHR